MQLPEQTHLPKKRRWLKAVTLSFLGLVLCAVIAFYIGVGPIDIAPSARDAPAAARAYRAAGWPWEAKDLNPNPPVRPDENAVPLLRQAIAALDPDRFDKEKPTLQELLNSGSYAQVQVRVAPYTKAMMLAEAASNKPRADYGRDWDLGPQLDFPEYRGIRALVRLLCARATLSARNHDALAAAQYLSDGWNLAAICCQEPMATSMFVNVRSKEGVLHACTVCASLVRGDTGALSVLENALARPGDMPHFLYHLRFEAYTGLAIFRNLDQYGGLFGLMRQLDQDASGQKPLQLNPARLKRTGMPEGMAARACIDHSFRYWAAVKSIVEEHERDPKRMEDDMEKAAHIVYGGSEIDAPIRGPSGLSHAFDDILMPTVGLAATAIIELRASIVTTRVLLKSLLIEAKTGRLPVRLSEIPGKWIDPFSGGQLRMKTNGSSIRIYSVGRNGRDDGGVGRESAPQALGDDIVAAYPPVKARSF